MSADREFLKDLLDTWEDDIEFLELEADQRLSPYELGYRDGLYQAIEQTTVKAQRALVREGQGEIYRGVAILQGALD